MVHDRDLLVKCVTRFYELLVHAAYLPASMIEYPPPTGWTDEELTVDMLRALGRNETVIDLLRHMPYIKLEPKYEVWEVTVAINFLRVNDAYNFNGATTPKELYGKGLGDFCLIPDDGNRPHWPAGLISLTTGRESVSWVIDTDEGM